MSKSEQKEYVDKGIWYKCPFYCRKRVDFWKKESENRERIEVVIL